MNHPDDSLYWCYVMKRWSVPYTRYLQIRLKRMSRGNWSTKPIEKRARK